MIKNDFVKSCKSNMMLYRRSIIIRLDDIDYVRRIKEEHLPNILLECRPKGIRRRSRPRMHWKNPIEVSLKAYKLCYCPGQEQMENNFKKHFYSSRKPNVYWKFLRMILMIKKKK